jgi:hypothetical protein
MPYTELKQRVLEVALDLLNRGPGYAQESVVLREAAERLRVQDNLRDQQQLLTCWHDLFREGKLSWGYDVDNPGAPFFHVVEPQSRN